MKANFFVLTTLSIRCKQRGSGAVMFSYRAVVLSFGAFAVSLAAGYYMKSMLIPMAKTLRRQKSKSDLRFGSFDTFEDWIRSKTFLSGLAHIEPQLEQIILQLLSAIEEVCCCLSDAAIANISQFGAVDFLLLTILSILCRLHTKMHT